MALCPDFDGTLSPIVDDPDQAALLPGMVELLGPLAARYAAVALVSGRPAGYLAKHAAAPGVRYLGYVRTRCEVTRALRSGCQRFPARTGLHPCHRRNGRLAGRRLETLLSVLAETLPNE